MVTVFTLCEATFFPRYQNSAFSENLPDVYTDSFTPVPSGSSKPGLSTHTHTHRGQIDGGWFLMSDSVDTSPPPSSCPVYYHRFTTHWITLDVPVWVMYYCRRRTLAKTGKKSHILSLLLERMCVIIFFKLLNEQNEQVWYEGKKLFRCSFAESLYLALESLIPIGQKASINFLLQQKMNPTLIQPRITGAITH